jgi:hypothetical protein
MKFESLIPAICLLAGLLQAEHASGVTLGQVDTFQDGTTENWTVGLKGGTPPSPPANVPTGGPAGAGDAYLLLTAVPPVPGDVTDPGTRLVTFNVTQWAGDYLAAGVGKIAMDLKNLGNSSLSIRLLFSDGDQSQIQNASNVAFSTNPVVLPVGSGWVSVVFPISPADLTVKAGDAALALKNAKDVRIYHSPTPQYPPPVIVAQLGVDNIQAVPAPNIAVTDSAPPADDLQLPFGEAAVGSASEQTVTVTNLGDLNLTLGTITGPASPFAVVSDGCSGQTLVPTASCTLTLRFAPTAEGSANGSIVVPSDDPDQNPVTVTLTGTGAVPGISVTDSISPADDGQLPFGVMPVGSTSDQTVTVANVGTADLAIGTITGPAVPFVIVTDGCSAQTLAPAANCTVTVRFTPVAAGPFTGSIAIPSNDPDSALVTLQVSGEAKGSGGGGGSSGCFLSTVSSQMRDGDGTATDAPEERPASRWNPWARFGGGSMAVYWLLVALWVTTRKSRIKGR